jgi:hypothetical protein
LWASEAQKTFCDNSHIYYFRYLLNSNHQQRGARNKAKSNGKKLNKTARLQVGNLKRHKKRDLK